MYEQQVMNCLLVQQLQSLFFLVCRARFHSHFSSELELPLVESLESNFLEPLADDGLLIAFKIVLCDKLYYFRFFKDQSGLIHTIKKLQHPKCARQSSRSH